MKKIYNLAPNGPKDPVIRPEVPHDPTPTEPEGMPDPPEQPDPYPVTDPPLTPDSEPMPNQDPGPSMPEPIPGAPPDVIFK